MDETQHTTIREQHPEHWAKCKARAAVNLERLLANRRRYADCTLANWDVDTPERYNIAETVRQWSRSVQQSHNIGRNVVCYGPAGTGKDHILAAMLTFYTMIVTKNADHIEDEWPIDHYVLNPVWISGAELFAGMRAAIDEKYEAGYLEQLLGADVLVISDPTIGVNATAYQLTTLYQIIDSRYTQMRPTWISCNATDREKLEARIGAPVVDRLLHDACVIPFNCGSYRREARKRQQ